jgi:hypothetical protein
LDSLTADEGALLLSRTAEREVNNEFNKAVTCEISDFVGGLLLAITTIGGYMKGTPSTMPEYLANLKRSNEVWARSGAEFVDYYDGTLGTVFNIALGELEMHDKNARSLLNISAFMNPDTIPEEVLVASHQTHSLQYLCNKDR